MASWRRYLVAVGLLLACAGAQAAVRMQAATLAAPGIELSGVKLDVALAANGRPALQLQVAKASVPALGWRDVALQLTGQPERAAGGAWQFVGKVEARRAPGGALGDAGLNVLYDPAGGTLAITLTQGKSRLDALLPLDQTSHLQVTLAGLPLAWLRGVLAAAWPAGRLTGGSVTGDVALDVASGSTRVSGRIAMTGAELDSKAGTVAAQKLGADGTFRIDTGTPNPTFMFDGQLRGGQLLAGPLYAQLPTYPVGLHVAGSVGRAGIALDSLDFDDPAALRVVGSLAFDARGRLARLNLQQFEATFPAAYNRYGTTLVQSLTGFTTLTTAGSIRGTFELDANGPQRIDLTARDLSFGGSDGNLQVAGLDGRIDWQAGASRPATRLKWQALALYRLAFGPVDLGLVDSAGTLALRAPANIDLLGGQLGVGAFAWRPDAKGAAQLTASLAVSGVDVSRLCKALGWPAFGGTLGGAAPQISYRDGDLAFAGGLSVNVFGGLVSVTRLNLRHPFGAMPQLAADIDMQQLDLAQLTGVFGFGEISGKMDGAIRGLQLVDWKPVAFNADLAANDGGKISQNAIKSLTEVGGGGIAGGLQGMALRLFKRFDYAKLGLSCTLAKGVCAMGGIQPDPDPDDHGYTIVEGRGLPRITVIGHERSVDWATLIGRLKAVTHGQAPVVR
ncbi:MAG TPA: hypothetical protein VF264_05485 [Rhodanobacteraceae bacterium]